MEEEKDLQMNYHLACKYKFVFFNFKINIFNFKRNSLKFRAKCSILMELHFKLSLMVLMEFLSFALF